MSKTYEYIIRKGKFDGFSYDMIIDGEFSPYSDFKTREEYIANGFEIYNEEEYDDLCKQFEKDLCNDWTEISEEDYEYALDVLPPYKWYDGGFFVSECDYGSVYPFKQKYNGKYYASLQSVHTPREEIIKNLKEYIASKN